MPRRSTASAVVLAAMIAVALALPAASAAGGRWHHSTWGLTRGSGYLALGDSVTFGYQEPGVIPHPNYSNAASFPGYPEQLGAELHLNVANASCPGETSSSLINPTAQSNGCENVPGHPHTGYRVSFPLHVRYKGSQLAYAVSYLDAHPGVRLVSLMIGANDYFVCTETTADKCQSPAEQHRVLARLGANIKTILSAIRNRAHYRGQIAIVDYFSLNYAIPATNAQSIPLNNTQNAAAKPFHVVIADGYGELKAASFRFGSSPCNAGLLTQLGTPGKCGIHPSFAGQSLLALALGRAVTIN